METTLRNESDSGKRLDWQNLVLAIGILLLAGVAVWMIAVQLLTGMAENRYTQAQAKFEEETGIRIVRVVLMLNGGIIDLQYQVLDPDKSLIVHDDDSPPTFIDGETGVLLATPFHEHSFRELHTGVLYHEMIMNGSGTLEEGSTVTLTIGESRLENIKVQQ